MQSLNLFDNQFSNFNAFKLFEPTKINNKRGLALLEQLQTTLELDTIISKYAMNVSKYVDFSGLYFESDHIKITLRGSQKDKLARQFTFLHEGDFIGMMTYSLRNPMPSSHVKILEELHQYLLHPLKNALAYKKAVMLAMQDGLTNLGNRRYFDEQLKRAMHHANRHRSCVGIIVADLNKFKAVNDTYGHTVGDKVLVHFSNALRDSVRDSDSLFRFGGDEFVVLVESASKESLDIIYQRIQQAVAEKSYLVKYHVSCSLGATFMNKADTEQSFFERADQALYRNKMKIPHSLSTI